jgi:hypothetical protein
VRPNAIPIGNYALNFGLLHAARPLRSWLIFDVRQKHHLPMTPHISLKQIVGGYAVAGGTLCFGLFLSFRLGPYQFQSIDVSGLYLKLFYFLALAIVLNFTCALGSLRGFPLRREDGGIIFVHLLRILVMTAIIWGAICFIVSPVVMFFFQKSQ